jgi:alpha-L-rhamnosidase
MSDTSIATVTHLRCEHMTNPVGIDAPSPRLSWWMRDDRRGAAQSAYRIEVASDPQKLRAGQADLWDSGKVCSDDCVLVPYRGREMTSRLECFWRVTCWDAEDRATQASETARWEMGLLDPSDWQAKWIQTGIVGGPRSIPPVPELRKDFSLASAPTRARLYVTALGLYEARINGRRVGDHELAPGWTDYRKQVRYQVYDVTDLLTQGDNRIAALLGDGWYAGHVEWKDRQFYGDRPRLLAQLEIQNPDASTCTVVTDETWQWRPSHILEADLIMGEQQDARLRLGQEPGCQGRTTFEHKAALSWAPTPTLTAMPCPPIRVVEELPAKALIHSSHGGNWHKNVALYDLGQNMVGRVRLKVSAPSGTNVEIRYGEVLDEKGLLYTENLRSARATDTFTTSEGEVDVFEPRFTFHGFRYVEIRGLPQPLPPEDVIGVVLSSDLEPTGEFSCSDELINQLQHNVLWGQRGNFLDVPTDCPQRDERLGWTGDAQVFARTACFNMNAAPFFAKWARDVREAQTDKGGIPPVAPTTNLGGARDMDAGPAWADAVIICPWTVYLCYGDKRILDENYRSMARYMDFMAENRCKDLIRSHPEVDPWGGFGDWLSMDKGATPKDLIGTAFYAYDAMLMARIAKILGKSADAARYNKLHQDVAGAFRRRFVAPEGLTAGHTQTAYVLALHFGLLEEQQKPGATDALVRDIHRRGTHLSTGFVGSPYLNFVLSARGRDDVAFELLQQKTWPSWLYAVTQGATTIWERWDGWTHDKGFANPGMNSFNHYAYGAIASWLYAHVAGLDFDWQEPAGKKLIVAPHPGGGLTCARARLATPHGMASSGWTLQAETMNASVTVPPSCSARVRLPAPADAVRESDARLANAERLQIVRQGDHEVVVQVGAGTYEFSLPSPLET